MSLSEKKEQVWAKWLVVDGSISLLKKRLDKLDKEFIKDLKEEFKAGNWAVWQIHKIINERAGKELI